MSQEAKFYVYILYRKNGITPFYVGMGSGNRWLDHERDCKPLRSYKDNIVAKFKAQGIIVPKHKVCEGLTKKAAHAIEIFLIAAIGRNPLGPLTNLTRGGDGCLDLSPESKEKHRRNTSLAQIGKTFSAQRNANLSAAKRGIPGKPHSEEWKKANSERLKLQWQDPALRAARTGMLGKHHSLESKEKIKESNKGQTRSLEVRMKMSEAAKLRRDTDEVRKAKSEAQKLRWARTRGEI